MLDVASRRRVPIDAETFHDMAERGRLPNVPLELVHGEILEMTPIGSRHGFVTTELVRRLTLAVGPNAVVTGSMPLRVDRHNEPQPDVMMLRPPSTRYRERLPMPADVLLVVEVSDTSYAYDREVKAALYAQAGIPESWIVDLRKGHMVRLTEPAGSAGLYGREAIVVGAALSNLRPEAFPEIVVDIANLFD